MVICQRSKSDRQETYENHVNGLMKLTFLKRIRNGRLCWEEKIGSGENHPIEERFQSGNDKKKFCKEMKKIQIRN